MRGEWNGRVESGTVIALPCTYVRLSRRYLEAKLEACCIFSALIYIASRTTTLERDSEFIRVANSSANNTYILDVGVNATSEEVLHPRVVCEYTFF